jgi:hypothetical protein
MLNDRERRVLAMMEQGLRDDEQRFVDVLRTTRAGPARQQHRWPIPALVGFGTLLVIVGLLTPAGGLFTQGLLFGAAGVAWSRGWRPRRAAVEPPGGARDQPSPRPGQTPPGWFWPA